MRKTSVVVTKLKEKKLNWFKSYSNINIMDGNVMLISERVNLTKKILTNLYQILVIVRTRS